MKLLQSKSEPFGGDVGKNAEWESWKIQIPPD